MSTDDDVVIESTTETPEKLEQAFGREPEDTKPGAQQSADGQRKKGSGEPLDNWEGVPSGARKRIEKLTARLHEAEGVISRLRGGAPRTEPGDANGNGNREPARTARRESEPARTEPDRTDRAASAQEVHDATAQELRGRYRDFDQVFEAAQKNNIQIPETAAAAINELPNAREIAYQIARNPNIAAAMLANPDRAPALVQQLSSELALRNHADYRGHAERVEASHKADPLTREEARRAHQMRLPNEARDVIVSLPNGPQILKHVVRNPRVYEAWQRMSPGKIIAEIGRLSERLAGGGGGGSGSRQRAVSHAPAPTTPVRGNGSRGALTLEEAAEEGENADTYIRMRDEAKRSRRRAS